MPTQNRQIEHTKKLINLHDNATRLLREIEDAARNSIFNADEKKAINSIKYSAMNICETFDILKNG